MVCCYFLFMATPLCTLFGECGGCSSQHIDYSLQLENKRKVLERAVNSVDVQVFSDKEYDYRNRMDFVFHKTGVGFRRKGKWSSIVPVNKCVISNEKINVLLKEINDFFKNTDYFDLIKQSGTFRYAVIRTPSNDSSISFVLNEDSLRLNAAVEKIEEFAKTSTANNIITTYTSTKQDESVSFEFFAVKGNDMLKETYLGKTFSYSVQGFFQNNSIMAEKMQEYVNNLLKKYDTKQAHLLDLYGGVGTFGIINSELFKGVTIIESIQPCIDAANENIQNNNIKNTSAIVLDAVKLKNVDLPQPLFVITDPPRSGMDPKTIEQLKKLQPKVIIYVSCNVEQLAKDIPKFKDYKVKSAALFDLFPQTPHSEGVVELVRE